MKRSAIFFALFLISSPVFCLTDIQLKRKTEELLKNLVDGHTFDFGKNNLYKEPLDLSMWNNAITKIKSFVTTVIDENKNFLGMRDSTLTKALNAIIKNETQLIYAIKVTRAILKSPTDLQKQIKILNNIKTDMLSLQKTLSSPMTPLIKEEARKLLNSTAMFIETTAAKAIKDTQQ